LLYQYQGISTGVFGSVTKTPTVDTPRQSGKTNKSLSDVRVGTGLMTVHSMYLHEKPICGMILAWVSRLDELG
jgi:hypothetical protein